MTSQAPPAAAAATLQWTAAIARLGVPILPAGWMLSLNHPWAKAPDAVLLRLVEPKMCVVVGTITAVRPNGQLLYAEGEVSDLDVAELMDTRALVPGELQLTRRRVAETYIGNTPIREITGLVKSVLLTTAPTWPGLWFELRDPRSPQPQ